MLSTRLFRHRFVPARRPGPGAKTMIVLHGLGDSGEGFAFLPETLGLDPCAYLLLDAPDPYYGGYSWFDFLGDPEPGVLRSRGLLRQLLEELSAQGVAPADVYLFGFSQGALMAIDCGLRYEAGLGGVCAVSGYVAFEEEYPEQFSAAARAQHFLATHGRFDAVVPFEPSARQFQRLQELGLQLEFKAYDKDHTLLPEELRDIAAWFRCRMGTAGPSAGTGS